MSIPNCSNGAEATATRGCVLPRASLVLTITTAQKIFAISSSRDKISCHNFARLSAWWVRLWRNQRDTTIVPRTLLHYNKLYFDKIFAFALEIAAFSM